MLRRRLFTLKSHAFEILLCLHILLLEHGENPHHHRHCTHAGRAGCTFKTGEAFIPHQSADRQGNKEEMAAIAGVTDLIKNLYQRYKLQRGRVAIQSSCLFTLFMFDCKKCIIG